MCAIDRTFRLSDKNGREDVRNFSADEIVRKMVVKPKHGALLTRLTNYFKPQTILQIGCAGGFSTLYLSAYASNIKAIVLEENAGWMSFDRLVFEKHGAKNIVLQEGAYRSILPEVVSEVGKVDFVYFDSFNDPDLNTFAFQQCLPCLHEKSVLMIAGIKKSGEMKALWKRLCAMSEVGVTMDVYEYGIVFFDKKLYKRNYIVSF